MITRLRSPSKLPIMLSRKMLGLRLPRARRGRASGTSFRHRVGPLSVGATRDATGVWLTWSVWGTGLSGRFRVYKHTADSDRSIKRERPHLAVQRAIWPRVKR